MSQFFQYKFFISNSAAVNYVCIYERWDVFQRWREEERTWEDRPFTIDIFKTRVLCGFLIRTIILKKTCNPV